MKNQILSDSGLHLMLKRSISQIIFAIDLHIRTNTNLQGANSTTAAFIGLLIMWICSLGSVNEDFVNMVYLDQHFIQSEI